LERYGPIERPLPLVRTQAACRARELQRRATTGTVPWRDEEVTNRYAENTDVSTERSRAEIERILHRYGADQFMYGRKPDASMIAFSMNGRDVKFVLPMPNREDFANTELGKRRKDSAIDKAHEQGCRQAWRALKLAIQAKLEVVEAGIACFEDEFMAYTVLPNGKTVGEMIKPQIKEAYESKRMPALLPDFSRGRK
jgi:hypothetical protein